MSSSIETINYVNIENDSSRSTRANSEDQGGIEKIISDLLDQRVLIQLEKTFNLSPGGRLNCSQLTDFLSKYLPPDQVVEMFQAMDTNDTGSVSFEDFTNYMIAVDMSDRVTNNHMSKLTLAMVQSEHHEGSEHYHRDSIDCVTYAHKPCSMIVSGGRDGLIGMWNTQNLSLIKLINYRDKNLVFQTELSNNMATEMKAQCIKNSSTSATAAAFIKVSTHNGSSSGSKQTVLTNTVPITSLCAMANTGLLCVGTADCCISIYELGTQELCGRFTELNHIPTSLEYFHLSIAAQLALQPSGPSAPTATSSTLNHSLKATYTMTTTVTAVSQSIPPTQFNTTYEPIPNQYLVIGDSKGFVHFIGLHPEFGSSTELGSKKKNQVLFAESLKRNYFKMSVHSDWINEMKYISEANSLLTASSDGRVCFIDLVTRQSNKWEVSKAFSGHSKSKLGVKTLDWSAFGKYVVSGAERTLLFWDIITMECIHTIDNIFAAAIVKVAVADEANKVIAALTNRSVYTWHNITFELLQTVPDSECVCKPIQSLSAMTFSTHLNSLFVGGNRLSKWSLERAPVGETSSKYADVDDICAVLYSVAFKLVVIVQCLGLVQIFEAQTGLKRQHFHITAIDPSTSLPDTKHRVDPLTGLIQVVVKMACLDSHETRLIVVGNNSFVQLINLIDGSPLLTMNPQLHSNSLAQLYANSSKLARSISHATYHTVLVGSSQIPKKLLLLGTNSGHICGYHEVHSAIDSVPIFFWMSENSNNRGIYSAKEPTEKELTLRPASKPLTANSARFPYHSYNYAGSNNEQQDSKAVTPLSLLNNSSTASTSSAVIWTYKISGSHTLLAGYANGIVIAWDLATQNKLYTLCDCSMQLGPELNGMRRHDGNIPDTNATMNGAVKQRHAGDLAPHSRFHPNPPHITTTAANATAVVVQTKEAIDEVLRTAQVTIESNRSKLLSKQSTRDRSDSVEVDNAENNALAVQPVNDEVVAAVAIEAVKTNHGRIRKKHERKKVKSHEKATHSAEKSAELSEVTEEAVSTEQVDLPTNELCPPTEEETEATLPLIVALEMPLLLPDNEITLKEEINEDLSRLGDDNSQADSGSTASQPAAHIFSSDMEDSAARMVRTSMTAMKQRHQSTFSRQSILAHNLISSNHGKASLVGVIPPKQISIAAPLSTADVTVEILPSPRVANLANIANQSIHVEPIRDEVPPVARNDIPKEKEVIVVDCAIVLNEFKMLIGACSDRYFRFWDLETNLVLCSCPYYHKSLSTPGPTPPTASYHHRSNNRSQGGRRHMQPLHHISTATVDSGNNNSSDDSTARTHQSPSSPPQPHKPKNPEAAVDIDEVLKHLKLISNDEEDFLVGGYDNGLVRVWAVQTYSITTLKGLLVKYLLSNNHSEHSSAHTPHHRHHQSLSHTSHTHEDFHNSHSRKKHPFYTATSSSSAAGHHSKTSQGFGYGLTIAPIMLLHEFKAHATPLIALEYMWFDLPVTISDKPTPPTNPAADAKKGFAFAQSGRSKFAELAQEGSRVTGYLLTAALDQTALLWRLDGRQIGRFGHFGWQLSDPDTWTNPKLVEMQLHMASGYYNNGNSKRKKMPQRYYQDNSTMDILSNLTKESLMMKPSPSTAFLRTFCRYILNPYGPRGGDAAGKTASIGQRVSSHQMNRYVETLSRKIHNRGPSYAQVDDLLVKVMAHHPMTHITAPLTTHTTTATTPHATNRTFPRRKTPQTKTKTHTADD